MSTEPIDLGVILTWPATVGPQDPPIPTDPWAPSTTDDAFPTAVAPALNGRPIVTDLKPCCGEVLAGDRCGCADMLAQLARATRRGPILFRFPTRRTAA